MNGTSSCSTSNGGASSSGTAIRGLVGQTIVHRCSTAGTEDCTLSDLECCTVYLLGPLAALFIHRLRGCRLYSGPVAGASFVEGASGIPPAMVAYTLACLLCYAAAHVVLTTRPPLKLHCRSLSALLQARPTAC